MSEYVVPIAITAVLIALNGLFVAAEFAIAGAPRTRFAQRAAEGHRTARVIHGILTDARNQDRYIATAQLGITFASLGLGMYGEHTLATWLYTLLGRDGLPELVASHAIASILAIAILTYFHIVLGEMIPKALALQHAEGTAIWVTPPMLWVRRALYPLVVLLNAVGNGTLRLFGVRRQVGSEQYYSANELEYIVRESERQGMLPSEPARILQELLEFGALTAEDVMVPRVRVDGVQLGATSQQLRDLIAGTAHTSYPVYENDLDHILGSVHIKDLLRCAQSGDPVSIDIVRSVPLLPETSRVNTVLEAMRRDRSHMVVVMDEHGGTAGIISLDDLFEEVLGEVSEGTAESIAQTDDNGRLIVDGTLRIEEAGQRVGHVLEHEDVETVSGLVLALLGRPPVVGDVVEYRMVRFIVTEVEGHGVARCAIEEIPPDA